MHWAEKYISLPWIQGARGPDTFDCWGLLICIYKERYNVELPDVPGADLKTFWRLINKEIECPTVWTREIKPKDGYAVAMGGTEMFHHVGVYLDIDGGLVLHAANMKNIVAQPLRGIRASGMRRIQFFRHNGADYRDQQSV